MPESFKESGEFHSSNSFHVFTVAEILKRAWFLYDGHGGDYALSGLVKLITVITLILWYSQELSLLHPTQLEAANQELLSKYKNKLGQLKWQWQPTLADFYEMPLNN